MTPIEPAVEVENCDECGGIRPVDQLFQVVGHGLVCERCCEELRDTGLCA